MKKNILEMFVEKLFAFPLWVKQIIYVRLSKHLKDELGEEFVDMHETELFPLYIPTLSFKGKTELTERKEHYEPTLYTFLEDVDKGFNILEISMNNFWTIEEVAKHYVLGVENALLKPSEIQAINAMGGFMAGKLRTGEYFKRIGRINVDQLERVLVKQKEYAASGVQKRMAEIMVELEILTEKDIHSLLIYKTEAQRRFILDTTTIPNIVKEPAASSNDADYKAQIQKLTEQNNQLKEQLKKMLAFVKKNG